MIKYIPGAGRLRTRDGVMTQVCPAPPGSNVMRSIHGVGELMTQVVLRGGGFLPVTPMAAAPEGNVKQAEPEKEDIMVMDTKLKIIEILQVALRPGAGHACRVCGRRPLGGRGGGGCLREREWR